jgi:excinuclease ABC subunit A
MPWKINGERWHMGDKGFPPGKSPKWERSLLTRLLQVVKSVEPNVAINWTTRDALTLRLPHTTKIWARWRTKDIDGVTCYFGAQKGSLNLTRLEGIGRERDLSTDKDVDVVMLAFGREEEVNETKLKELLTLVAKSFRADYETE